MDLMKVDNCTVLHIVERDTKFGAAAFLEGEKQHTCGKRSC